ncbi:hypothetical protein T484DRAFT_1780422 [Baffinella frigidus]|nr:hypothetical protein T484DRAFT_1780422 [Cryptophyta sp. CCMP2293]
MQWRVLEDGDGMRQAWRARDAAFSTQRHARATFTETVQNKEQATSYLGFVQFDSSRSLRSRLALAQRLRRSPSFRAGKRRAFDDLSTHLNEATSTIIFVQELSDAAQEERTTPPSDDVDYRRQGISRFNLGDAAKVRALLEESGVRGVESPSTREQEQVQVHKSLLEATRGLDQSPTKGSNSHPEVGSSKSSNSHPEAGPAKGSNEAGPSKGSNSTSEAGPSGGGGFSGEDLAAAMSGMSPISLLL